MDIARPHPKSIQFRRGLRICSSSKFSAAAADSGTTLTITTLSQQCLLALVIEQGLLKVEESLGGGKDIQQLFRLVP